MYEQYLDVLPMNLRSYLCKLILSSHSLHNQTGRFSRHRIPRKKRFCQLCNLNDLENEFHFVLKCPLYSDIRIKLLLHCFSKIEMSCLD